MPSPRRYRVEITRHSGHHEDGTIAMIDEHDYPTAAAASQAAQEVARQYGRTTGWRVHNDLNGQYLLLPDGMSVGWREVRE